MNKETTNNKYLTSKELYELLKKLGVIQKIKESKALAFLEYIMEKDGKLGNPNDRQSMIELKNTLLELKVDIKATQNIRIITEALCNTEDSKTTSTDLCNIERELEACIELVMLELGFNPSFEGFPLFRDGVLHLLTSTKKTLWQKEGYAMLGEKYNLSGTRVERNIRNCITNGYKNHYNNATSQYIYFNKESITNTECLYSVAEYIKYNEQKIKEELVSYAKNIDITNMNLEQIVDQTLRTLGITPNIKGYNYIKDAVIYALEANGPIRGNNLYERIAQKYPDTPEQNVARGILTAILKSNKQYFELINKNDKQSDNIPEEVKFVYKYTTKFENFEFIAIIAEYVKLITRGKLIEINQTNNKNQTRIKTI